MNLEVLFKAFMLTCKFVNYFLKINLFGAQYTVTIDLGEPHIYMYCTFRLLALSTISFLLPFYPHRVLRFTFDSKKHMETRTYVYNRIPLDDGKTPGNI